MKSKKLRILTALLSAVMCLGLLAGCSSTESKIKNLEEIAPAERTAEQWLELVMAYEESGQPDASADVLELAIVEYGVRDPDLMYCYAESSLKAGPTPSVESGSYEGQLTVFFDGELDDGEVICVIRDGWNDYAGQVLDYAFSRHNPIEELGDLREYAAQYAADDMYIGDANNPVEIHITKAGDHTFYAFTVKNGIVTSGVSEGAYQILGPDFSELAFSTASGVYEETVTTSIVGAEGTVYYTTDGTDPVENGQPTTTARVLDDKLELGHGKYDLKAQCITDDGFVSPVVEAWYYVSMVFDSYSIYVAQDDQYDYVVDQGALKVYDSEGSYVGTVAEKNVHAFNLIWSYTNNEDKIDDYESATTGWLAQSLSDVVQETVLYVQTVKNWKNGVPNVENTRLIYQNGKLVDESNDYKMPHRVVANCWMVFGTKASEYKQANKVVGTAELAADTVLMTSKCAVTWTLKDEIVAYDLDGGNKRVLWTAKYGDINLHALTENLIIFSNNGKSLAYDFRTGEARELTIVPQKWDIIGCTTHAIYAEDETGAVQRIEVDYNTI